MNIDRIKKEESYHNKRFSEDDIIRVKTKKYYSINKYLKERFLEIVSKNANNKNLLCSRL